jgi:predicted acetyltransferase
MAQELACSDEPFYKRPYEKFEERKVIVRLLGETNFPHVDDSPGISSWFKVEVYDFYHNGLKVVLAAVYYVAAPRIRKAEAAKQLSRVFAYIRN